MFKNKVKGISIMLSVAMGVSLLAGCNSNSGSSSTTPASTPTPAASQAPADTTTGKEEAPAEGGTEALDYEISILTISHDGQLISEKHPNYQTLEDHTGYRLKLEYVLNANYEEQLNTRLASGDLPGLVVLTGNSAPIVTAAKSGAFWDITEEYLKYPNLAVADKNIMNNISIEGRYYGIYRSRTIGRNGITYRSDWLDNLGLEEPKTIDDLYNTLHAFTYNDPNQSGNDDTYGMTWCTYMGPFDNIAVMHGAPNEWGIDGSGKLYPAFETDEYIAAMDFAKKLYDEKIINQDFPALQTGDWTNDFRTGKTGMHIDVADEANRSATKLKENGFITQEQVDDGSIVWVMGSVETADGNKYALPTPGNAGYVAISRSTAKTEEDLNHYLTFMDKCNDEIGQNILEYGTEGVTYEITNGVVTRYIADEVVAIAGAGMDITTGWNQFMMNASDKLYPLKQNPRVDRQREVWEQNLPYAVHNPTLPLNSATWTEKNLSLKEIREDAIVNYIMGKIDLDGFKKETDRWYAEGGQAALDEFQAAYDASK